MKVSVIGLGKLGLPLAAVLAEAGNQVFAYDASKILMSQLKNNSFQSGEPKLMELLNEFKVNIIPTDSIHEAVLKSELTFIIVPTPSMQDGYFDNRLVIEVLTDVSQTLKEKTDFHVIDVVSTVMPGSCDAVFIPLLEEHSGKVLNEGFGLCYNPEFIALGSVVKNMQNPDMHLIGASNAKSGDILEQALKSVTGSNVPSRVMNLKEAELVKISVNNFVTAKISFANMLMQISDKLGGIDVDVVTDAIGLDSRIGRKYLRGGTSYGGPCFPRDTRAMSALMSQLELNPAIPEATSSVNQNQNEFLINKILEHIGIENKIGLIGFSYKPDTNVYEESTGFKLANILNAMGKDVLIWEPLIDFSSLGNELTLAFAMNLMELASYSVLILTREFTNFEMDMLMKHIDSHLILDPWRQLTQGQVSALKSGIIYVPIGRNT